MSSLLKGFILVLVFSYTATVSGQTPDLILTHGKVFTSDTSNLYAEAIAIKGTRIVAVGRTIDIEKLAGRTTRRIDLGGRTVIPGINDAHDHMGFGAQIGRFINFSEPMLAGPGFQQLLDSLALIVKQVPKGTIIQANLGLRIIEDSSARRKALDKVAPDHVVILRAPWGHGTIINTRAMQMLGIVENAKDPIGGSYERLPGTQELSGLLSEYAEFTFMREWYGALPDKTIVEMFRGYGNHAVQMGITSVQNMATALPLDKTVMGLKEAKLPIRVRVIRFPGTNTNQRELAKWSTVFASTPYLQVTGMKWILDATPLERGALMRTDYTDKLAWKGGLNFPLDTVRKILNEGLQSKEQLLLHIVGDSTPNLVISEMMKMAASRTWSKKRVRFEHADGLLEDQWANAREAGIVAVVNPLHFSFAEVNHLRLGNERAGHYQPQRSLIEAGIPVAIGSDGPNNPYLNIMMATIHPTNPKEAITREQAVIAYTKGSAYAEFMEKEKGMLKPGMLADIAVLSQDIFSIPTPSLPGTVSVMTIVGGKIVYNSLTPKK